MEKTSGEVGIVGGGLAGLSAAIYLARAQRDVLIVDSQKSMARWEPMVQNYLGFPKGISGNELISRGLRQARRYGTRVYQDEIVGAFRLGDGRFHLNGNSGEYFCERLLVATGIFHVPPEIPGVKPCLGHSMFFCKDCDGYKLHGRHIAVYGWTDDAVEYALGMLLFSPCVVIATDGHEPKWSERHRTWIEEYHLPVYQSRIINVRRRGARLQGLVFADHTEVCVKALFTVRGDVYYNAIGRALGAELDKDGELVVDSECRTSVPGLYAAGCVTPANCQMIIAAGQGATAAQAINRDLFEQSLSNHKLRRYRISQVRRQRTRPRKKRALSGLAKV